MTAKSTIVRFRDLEPSWHVKGAKEPGSMRWLVNWVGGSEGYYNSNPGVAVVNDKINFGLMHMPVGNRQRLHTHTIAEIYVILKGHVEAYDGNGRCHIAGPLDCLYTPPRTPHCVRTVGDEDLWLIWLHDRLEKKGSSVYLEGDGPFPSETHPELVRFSDLEPHWGAERAKEPGFMRWSINWVGGREGFENCNRGVSIESGTVACGLTVIPPGNKEPLYSRSDPEVQLVVRGKAVTRLGGRNEELGPLDALYCPPGSRHSLRNVGEDMLYVMWVQSEPQKIGAATFVKE